MTTNHGLVSIVMPVYNGEAFLAEAIDSVIAQTYARWELIVIDDGSTDDTARIVNSYDDPRIRYSYQTNSGQTAALNAGLDQVQGEFVTTLDADDAYPADSLQVRANFLNEHLQFGAVYGDGQYCDVSGKALRLFSEQMPAGVSGDVYDLLIVSPFYGTGASVMIRREVLLNHEIRYDDTIVWCQDWDFYIRLAACTSIGFADTVTVFYRIHESGMTSSMPYGKRLDSLIRTRYKVLTSSRFAEVDLAQQKQFFYDFLLNNLRGQPTRQEYWFVDDIFRRLPHNVQADLLRQTAITYLLEGTHLTQARKWLWRAWKQNLRDIKTATALVLSLGHMGVLRHFIKAWQARQHVGGPVSPFATIDEA